MSGLWVMPRLAGTDDGGEWVDSGALLLLALPTLAALVACALETRGSDRGRMR